MAEHGSHRKPMVERLLVVTEGHFTTDFVLKGLCDSPISVQAFPHFSFKHQTAVTVGLYAGVP